MTMNDIAHASFGNFDSAFFSQNSIMRNDHEFISSQCLQYDDQHKTSTNSQQKEMNLNFNEFALETFGRNSAIASTVSIDDNYAQYFSDSDDVFTINADGDYAHYFLDSENVFRTATGNNYAHYSSNPGEVYTTGDYAVDVAL